jgi:hypothetical protein
MTVTVTGDNALTTSNYVFTIFESDENELRELAEDYKYGSGVYWNRPGTQNSIFVPIHEATGLMAISRRLRSGGSRPLTR